MFIPVVYVMIYRGTGIAPCRAGQLGLGSVNYDDMMPLDPFKDDPNDPASFIEDDEVVEPLTDEERELLERFAALRGDEATRPKNHGGPFAKLRERLNL